MATAIREVEQRQSLYSGTPYIPIFVMLPLGTVSKENQVAEPERLRSDLEALKRVGVDGVMVDCWWGMVEKTSPQIYDWSGYRQLFSLVRNCKLKLQLVMSFHQCGGNVGDNLYIPLPKWVLAVGQENPDIFFTNQAGVRNPECLTIGIDNEPVLQGRTSLQVYYDYMRSFRTNFHEFLDDGTITEIEVGMVLVGSFVTHLTQKPKAGSIQAQCWDKYLLKSLKKAAEAQGQPTWADGPSDAGDYNSTPEDSKFFRDGYKSPYGEFFLTWYSQTLIEHGDSVLRKARQALGSANFAAKVSGIHWWYRTESHAAELAAGYYNVASRCGYTPIASMLAIHNATFNFTCIELRTADQTAGCPQSDPEALVSQVLQAARAQGVNPLLPKKPELGLLFF